MSPDGGPSHVLVSMCCDPPADASTRRGRVRTFRVGTDQPYLVLPDDRTGDPDDRASNDEPPVDDGPTP